jgi:hypothetical protein
VLGRGNVPTAHELKEAEREPGNMEASPHIVRRQGTYNTLIEIRSRYLGEK